MLYMIYNQLLTTTSSSIIIHRLDTRVAFLFSVGLNILRSCEG